MRKIGKHLYCVYGSDPTDLVLSGTAQKVYSGSDYTILERITEEFDYIDHEGDAVFSKVSEYVVMVNNEILFHTFDRAKLVEWLVADAWMYDAEDEEDG